MVSDQSSPFTIRDPTIVVNNFVTLQQHCQLLPYNGCTGEEGWCPADTTSENITSVISHLQIMVTPEDLGSKSGGGNNHVTTTET